MHSRYELGKVLFSEEEIRARVKELGAEITKDYEGEPVLCVGVLKGAVMFMTDLVRELKGDFFIDFMAVSSYGASTKSSGVVRIIKDLDRPLNDYHLLIIEDIVDSGLTLKYLKEVLEKRGPKSVKIVTLLDKPSGRRVELTPDYSGFLCPDEFIVGYGLDVDEYYRNVPYIASVIDHGENK